MLALALALCLQAAPMPKLATTSLTPLDVSKERAAYYLEQLAIELSSAGFQVTTPADLAAVLGLERQRALMGCDDRSSCLAELAGGLGVDGLVVGQVAQVGDRLRLSIKLLEAASGRAAFVFSDTVDGDAAVLVALARCAQQAAAQLLPPPPRRNPLPLVVAGVGLVAAAVGGGLLISAKSSYDSIQARSPAPLPEAVTAAAQRGRTHQTVGLALGAGGAAALAGALLWYALMPQSVPPPTVALGPGSIAVGWAAAW